MAKRVTRKQITETQAKELYKQGKVFHCMIHPVTGAKSYYSEITVIGDIMKDIFND